MHFPNYGLEKTWLDKCLKTVFISGDRSTFNIYSPLHIYHIFSKNRYFSELKNISFSDI